MTSDSDFTPLVMRLRSSGVTVYGFGDNKTPMPFVKACSQFIYTENLESDGDDDGDADAVFGLLLAVAGGLFRISIQGRREDPPEHGLEGLQRQ